jgi:hypothetical protein
MLPRCCDHDIPSVLHTAPLGQCSAPRSPLAPITAALRSPPRRPPSTHSRHACGPSRNTSRTRAVSRICGSCFPFGFPLSLSKALSRSLRPLLTPSSLRSRIETQPTHTHIQHTHSAPLSIAVPTLVARHLLALPDGPATLHRINARGVSGQYHAQSHQRALTLAVGREHSFCWVPLRVPDPPSQSDPRSHHQETPSRSTLPSSSIIARSLPAMSRPSLTQAQTGFIAVCKC